MLLFCDLSLSENYLVKWSSSGLVKDIDQLHNLRAVFTVCVFASMCVCVCARSPVVVQCLSSRVMRPVGACLQSLYLLSSQKELGSLYVFTKAATSI